jgi:hypothetical protein
MSVINMRASNMWERSCVLTFLVAAIVASLTISRTLAPEELIKKLDSPWTWLGWAPFALVAIIWLSDFAWRVEAVVWLQTMSCVAAASMMILFGTSAAFHLLSDAVVNTTLLVVSILLLVVFVLFAWGFYQRRAWARTISLLLCQIGVIGTIVIGFFSGIKASEMWSTLQCAATWYWLSRPSVEQVFQPKVQAA